MRGKCRLCRISYILLFTLVVEQDIGRRLASGQTYCEDKPKILFYRRGQAALVSGGSEDVGNHVVLSNLNKEFLACVSSRNVEWAYEGEGEPSKFQESNTVDIQKYEDGSISYCLTSQITFYNKQSDSELSRHTGRYTCREIGNITNVASVYVFASRRNSPTFIHSRKTVTLPLSKENMTSFPPSDNNDPKGGSVDKSAAIPQRSFTIPCATTRPNVSVKLLKKGKNGDFSAYTKTTYEFDPKSGVRVNASNANLNDLADFYGEYKCLSSASTGRSGTSGNDADKAEGGQAEDFVLFTIIKAKSFQVFPPVNEVYTSGLLNLTCESEEPVIMKEILPTSAHDVYSYLDEDDYARDRSDDIVETTERTEQKTHIANYMELAPAPGRTGEIQCMTEKEGKVLHIWKYRVIRKRANKLSGIKFNKRENSFTCKSKLGTPGRLSFVSCRTPSECRVNRICLTKSENCRGYSNSTRAFCERKSHFCGKIFYKGGSGLIRCIGEGVDETRGFTDEASGQTVHMGFGKLKASETALLLLAAVDKSNDGHGQGQQTQQTTQENGMINEIREGDRVNVTLRLGYYYFLYPVQWAVKFRNGSSVQLNPDSQTLQVERLTRTVSATVTLPYTSATHLTTKDTVNGDAAKVEQPQLSEIVALHALIPLRSSVDPSWKTIALPITVYGRVGLTQLPSGIESEEVAAISNSEPSPKEQSDIEAYEDEEEDQDDANQDGLTNAGPSNTSTVDQSHSTSPADSETGVNISQVYNDSSNKSGNEDTEAEVTTVMTDTGNNGNDTEDQVGTVSQGNIKVNKVEFIPVDSSPVEASDDEKGILQPRSGLLDENFEEIEEDGDTKTNVNSLSKQDKINGSNPFNASDDHSETTNSQIAVDEEATTPKLLLEIIV